VARISPDGSGVWAATEVVMEFGWGLVIGAVAIGVLFVHQVGEADELMRRLYQLGLALIVALLVLSIATLLIRPANDSVGGIPVAIAEIEDFDAESQANRVSARRSIAIGLGALTLVGGLMSTRRWSTLPLAFVASGVFTIVIATAGTFLDSYIILFSEDARSSVEVDATYTLVLIGATSVLTWYGLRQYESDLFNQTVEEEPTAEP
jgi:hypothetical protein